MPGHKGRRIKPVEIDKGERVPEGKEGEREEEESETWQMNSNTYQDKHASIHVENVHDTYQHKMVYI